MRPFCEVVAPHPDVLLPHTRVEKYVADLWKVSTGDAAPEYQDADKFFAMTHLTRNMAQILDDIRNKLIHGKGDAFRHVETAFGGGKTHTMIAAYHKAKEWNIKVVVIDGTKLSADDTLWGVMEEQLEGEIITMAGFTSPGGIKIKKLLDKHQQILILIDELGEYMVKALGRPVGSSTLASQTGAFMQELTSEVANADKICVLASFLASGNVFLEKEKNWIIVDKMLHTLGKLTGRHDHKIMPVSVDDIPDIIRHRLFTAPDDTIGYNAKHIISEFTKFCEKNKILPPGVDGIEYTRQFAKTYPFLPDVIYTLYDTWGTYSSFQKTRGVLKVLAMVVNNLKDSDIPYITLADFDLSDDILRHELIQHIEYDDMDDIIYGDITGSASGGKNIPYGVPCATAIFMKSFGKNDRRGATITEIKRAVADSDIHPADVSDTVKKLTHRLHYMKNIRGRYRFSNKPNVNRIKADTEVFDDEIKELEQKMLNNNVGSRIRTYVWPDDTMNVDDDDSLKLVILDKDDIDTVGDFMNHYGGVNRSNKNAVLVLCPSDIWHGLHDTLQGIILINKIFSRHHDLSEDDHTLLQDELSSHKSDISGALLNGYNVLYVPGANGPERVKLPLFTTDSGLISDAIYDFLLNGVIHEKLAPHLLLYSDHADIIYTNNMFGSMLRNPGSRRPTSKNVIKDAIISGVEKKLFGLGIKTKSGVMCKYYGDTPTVSFADNEVIIKNPKSSNVTTSANYNDARIRSDKIIHDVSFGLTLRVDNASGLAKVIARMQKKGFAVNIVINCANGIMTESEMEDIKDMIYDINPNFTVKTDDDNIMIS